MSAYSFRATVHSRSRGRSATASAAYRAGEKIVDHRTGLTFDYSKKSGVLSATILAPAHAGAWVYDRAGLWNQVEAAETRKNSQVCKELLLALPHELTDEQRKELVHRWAQRELVGLGMVADVCIHLPDQQGDQRNHHAHILITTRRLTDDGSGFAGKDRSWNDKDLLQHWRKSWAEAVNACYLKHGHAVEWSHESYEARGLDRVATVHLGPAASEMERKGIETDLGTANLAAKAYNLRAEVIELAAYRRECEQQLEDSILMEKAHQELAQVIELEDLRAQRQAAAPPTLQGINRQLDQLDDEQREAWGARATLLQRLEDDLMMPVEQALSVAIKQQTQAQKNSAAWQPSAGSSVLGRLGRWVYQVVTGKTYVSAEEQGEWSRLQELQREADDRLDRLKAEQERVDTHISQQREAAGKAVAAVLERRVDVLQAGVDAGLLASPAQLLAVADRIRTELPRREEAGELYRVRAGEALGIASSLESVGRDLEQGRERPVSLAQLEAIEAGVSQGIAAAHAAAADFRRHADLIEWVAAQPIVDQADCAPSVLAASDALHSLYAQSVRELESSQSSWARHNRRGPGAPSRALDGLQAGHALVERVSKDPAVRESLHLDLEQAKRELQEALQWVAQAPDDAELAQEAMDCGMRLAYLGGTPTKGQQQQLEALERRWEQEPEQTEPEQTEPEQAEQEVSSPRPASGMSM